MKTNFTISFRQHPNRWLWVLFFLSAVAVSIRNILLPSGDIYTHYNNYIIFKQSFYHLIHGKNLYLLYPQDQYDLYKYSPAFALFFGFLAWMPDILGLTVWNLINVFVLVYAIQKLPLLSEKLRLIFGLLVLQECITSTMNSQSNALIAGLLILAFVQLEKNKTGIAAICVLATVFVKLFGIVFFMIFLFYPKWYKAIIPALIAFIILVFSPVFITGFTSLWQQYLGYFNLLNHDHGVFLKYSVMGWLKSWFGFDANKNAVVLFGLLFQLALTLKMLFRKTTIFQRALMAGSWMIWMVIFNHMAESATFIIAVSGIMLWFFYSGMNKWFRILIILPVMAFTCFGPSDLYPPTIREWIVVDLQLKVFPCIMSWVIITGELLFGRFKNKDGVSVSLQNSPSESTQALPPAVQ